MDALNRGGGVFAVRVPRRGCATMIAATATRTTRPDDEPDAMAGGKNPASGGPTTRTTNAIVVVVVSRSIDRGGGDGPRNIHTPASSRDRRHPTRCVESIEGAVCGAAKYPPASLSGAIDDDAASCPVFQKPFRCAARDDDDDDDEGMLASSEDASDHPPISQRRDVRRNRAPRLVPCPMIRSQQHPFLSRTGTDSEVAEVPTGSGKKRRDRRNGTERSGKTGTDPAHRANEEARKNHRFRFYRDRGGGGVPQEENRETKPRRNRGSVGPSARTRWSRGLRRDLPMVFNFPPHAVFRISVAESRASRWVFFFLRVSYKRSFSFYSFFRFHSIRFN